MKLPIVKQHRHDCIYHNRINSRLSKGLPLIHLRHLIKLEMIIPIRIQLNIKEFLNLIHINRISDFREHISISDNDLSELSNPNCGEIWWSKSKKLPVRYGHHLQTKLRFQHIKFSLQKRRIFFLKIPF